MEPTSKHTNPYEVTSELKGISKRELPSPEFELTGVTQTQLAPIDIRRIELELRKPMGSLWVLPSILFIVFCGVAYTIPTGLETKIFLWVLVGAIPILSWGAIYSSIRTVAPGLRRLEGCGEFPVRLQLDPRGFRLMSEGLEQFGIWAMMHGHVANSSQWILLFTSAMHRSGLVIATALPPEKIAQLDRFALSCRRDPANQKVSNRLSNPVEFQSVHLQPPVIEQTARVYSRDMIDETPEDWIWLRRYFIASALLRIDLVLLAGTTLTSVLASPWISIAVVFPLALATLFKMRRGLRVLFNRNAVVSELELKISVDGYEKRSNAHHSRVLWKAHRDLEITKDRILARHRGSNKRQPIFARSWFASDSDWETVCQLAIEGSK